MCLGVPMRVDEIDRGEVTARCSYEQIRRTVSLYLVEDQNIAIGDFLLVHVGYALQKLNGEEALACLRLLREAMGEGDVNA